MELVTVLSMGRLSLRSIAFCLSEQLLDCAVMFLHQDLSTGFIYVVTCHGPYLSEFSINLS